MTELPGWLFTSYLSYETLLERDFNTPRQALQHFRMWLEAGGKPKPPFSLKLHAKGKEVEIQVVESPEKPGRRWARYRVNGGKWEWFYYVAVKGMKQKDLP